MKSMKRVVVTGMGAITPIGNSVEEFWNGRNSARQKEVYIPSSQDSFMRMFLRNYCLRPSCYECEAKLVRCADLTLADFWGINFVAPEMNDNKGVSLVIIRSQRGQSFV